jgi:hypothetical protein
VAVFTACSSGTASSSVVACRVQGAGTGVQMRHSGKDDDIWRTGIVVRKCKEPSGNVKKGITCTLFRIRWRAEH